MLCLPPRIPKDQSIPHQLGGKTRRRMRDFLFPKIVFYRVETHSRLFLNGMSYIRTFLQRPLYLLCRTSRPRISKRIAGKQCFINALIQPGSLDVFRYGRNTLDLLDRHGTVSVLFLPSKSKKAKSTIKKRPSFRRVLRKRGVIIWGYFDGRSQAWELETWGSALVLCSFVEVLILMTLQSLVGGSRRENTWTAS